MAELRIEVSDELAAEIAEALRETYPEVTAGTKTDAAATRAVIGWLMANVLAEYQATKVREAGEEEVAAAQKGLANAVANARSRAWEAINAAIATDPSIPSPPTPAADKKKEQP